MEDLSHSTVVRCINKRDSFDSKKIRSTTTTVDASSGSSGTPKTLRDKDVFRRRKDEVARDRRTVCQSYPR